MGERRQYRSYEIGIVDENSAYLGVDRRLLMENAGAAVARVLAMEVPDLTSAKVLVVAGPGNNGGDALVAARHLAGKVARLSVILLARPDQIRTPEAAANWEAISRMRRSVDYYVSDTLEALYRLQQLFREADIIIDGIFGTGIRGEIREPYKTAINFINSPPAKVFSIDVPSGMDPDTGKYTTTVRPSVTITLHGAKPFMTLQRELAGKTYIEPIGAPPDAEAIAGPGDLAYSLSRLRRPVSASIRGGAEEARGAAEVLRILGVEPRVEMLGGGLTVTVDGLLVGYGVAESFGSLSALVKPIQEQVGGDAADLAKTIGKPVYLVGGWDSISDGVYLKSNWIEPPVSSRYILGVATSLSAAFLANGVEPIYAIGAACYAARRPLRGRGSEDREAYLDGLRQLLLRK
ncbi:Bifunctional NAD(P)H-hydrate repair enzyme Nnr [Candidatus Calditenuaceae archaeon HR02]|nr:Bifunctional NAD(P)H-hydrate repair enzyme Nnr [Candidatus Calditenuaceae archaeon HR02]